MGEFEGRQFDKGEEGTRGHDRENGHGIVPEQQRYLRISLSEY